MNKKKEKKSHVWKRIFVWGMVAASVLSVKLPVSAAVTNADLANPVVDEESHSKIVCGDNTYIPNKHTSFYHYVYFGSYPQKEISGDELTDAIRNAAYDTNGEAEIDGKKYRRLTYEMTTCSASLGDDGWHLAKEKEFDSYAENGYRYFLYEPIKWRILENNSGQLTLFSEMLLDYQAMNSSYGSNPTWEACEMRRWLNYDGSTGSTLGKRFRSKGFMSYAFNRVEQSKIQISRLEQDNNPQYAGSDENLISGGKDTDDKIYLLNYSDTGNIVYGFCNENNICYPQMGWGTDFSFAMAVADEECFASESGNEYWIRTPGEGKGKFMTNDAGDCRIFGLPGDTICYVRPVVNVNYSLNDCIRVSFVTNTNAKVEEQILLQSNYAKEPEILVRDGYKFTGWYTDSACTKQYKFNYRLVKDTVLYAGWEKSPLPKNTTIKDSGVVYKVLSAEQKAVEYTGRVNMKGKQAKKAVIPATVTYDGITYRVTAVGEKAFKNDRKLETVTIGKNITQIKEEAFRGCIKLKKVVIGKNVTQIKARAFRGCKSLRTVTVGAKISKIGVEAFRGCKNLGIITIKTKKMKSVGKNAFYQIKGNAVYKVPKKKYKAYKKLLAEKRTGYRKGMKIKKEK